MDKKKTKYDIIIMIILFVLSILLITVIIPNQVMIKKSWNDHVYTTSRTMPYILSACLAFLSFIGILKNVIIYIKFPKAEINKKSKINFNYSLFVPLIICIAVFFYIKGIELIGFPFATLVYIVILLAALKCKKWKYYIYSVAFSAVLYIVFKFLLNVPL